MMKDIISKIDHTNLSPTATEKDILAFAEKAVGTGIASLCIAPCYVEMLSKRFMDAVPICTVVGFPNGYEAVDVKASAVGYAFAHGASEVDYVLSLGRIKAGEYGGIYQEVRQALYHKPQNSKLKIIMETGALEDDEIIRTIQTLNQLPIDFYKTSTGFKYPGASVHAASLIMAHKRDDIGLKVSGGIATVEDARVYIGIGATRIGASKLLDACLKNQQ